MHPSPALPKAEQLELSSAMVGDWSGSSIKEVSSVIPEIVEAPYRVIEVDVQLC
jgi:hypothetical protein